MELESLYGRSSSEKVGRMVKLNIRSFWWAEREPRRFPESSSLSGEAGNGFVERGGSLGKTDLEEHEFGVILLAPER